MHLWSVVSGIAYQGYSNETTGSLHIYCIEQRAAWEGKRFAASQEISHILWNPKVHYRIYKCPPPVPFLSQINPDHPTPPHFLKITLTIILPSMPRSYKWFFPSGFPTSTLYTPFLSTMCYMAHPSHSSWFYYLHNIGWGVQIIKLLIM